MDEKREIDYEKHIDQIEHYATIVIPQVKAEMFAHLTQIKLNRAQLALISDQKEYTSAIKRATWIIAIATVVQVAIAILSFFKEPATVVIRQPQIESAPIAPNTSR
jgi:hypothetical protein